LVWLVWICVIVFCHLSNTCSIRFKNSKQVKETLLHASLIRMHPVLECMVRAAHVCRACRTAVAWERWPYDALILLCGLCAKDKHCFKSDLILPLKASRFEDSDVYVPNDIESCLIQEYGPNVLKNTYKDWFFENETWTKKQD
jgi:hypothetical protein